MSQQNWGQTPQQPGGQGPQQPTNPQVPSYGQQAPQGYGQQAAQGQAYGVAGQAAPQTGYGAGQPPYGNAPSGFQTGGQTPPPAAPKKKGNGLIIGLIAGGLALAALVGVLLGLNHKRSEPVLPETPTATASASTEPTTSATTSTTSSTSTTSVRPSASTSASTRPSTSATAKPSTAAPSTAKPSSSASTGTTTTGSTVPVGEGIVAGVPAGWKVDKQGDGSVTLTNGRSYLNLEAFQTDGTTDASTMLQSWLDRVGATLQSPASAGPDPVTVTGAKQDYTAADAALGGVMSTTKGSTEVEYYSGVVVRKSDGLAVTATALYLPANRDTITDPFNKAIGPMIGQLLG